MSSPTPSFTFNNANAKQILLYSIKPSLYSASSKWGLVIVRGSYASQTRWDKFLFLIKQDTLEYLDSICADDPDNDPSHRDLLVQNLEWTVLEDAPSLDGVDYQIARDRFDEWARGEIERDTKDVDVVEFATQVGVFSAEERERRFLWKQEPRKKFFVFADEASVDSVVDCDAQNNRGKVGGYYFLVVKSGLGGGPEEHLEDEEKEEEEDEWDDDEVDGEGWCDSRQKFRAWDLGGIYASLVLGNWPDEYIDRDAEGVISIGHI